MSSPGPLARRWFARVLMGLALGVAAFFCLYRLDEPLMWCDEAESSINALTILQHGVPTDSYLGLPIFENTLTEPWPGHPEYEFRDTSYSKKGLAIYHGWLPLYVMAGSLKLFGVEPDVDDGSLRVKHSDEEIRRRTMATRVPSVLFGLAFIVVLYFAARELYGRDAAWALVLAASTAMPLLRTIRQARYYALTLLLCTACCWAAWRIYTRARWRDYVVGGILFALLFHSQILTFVIACAATSTLVIAQTIRTIRRREPIGPLAARWGLFCGIILTAMVPWLIGSGFFDAAGRLPRAWDYLLLPNDLLLYPLHRWVVTLVLVLGTIWVILVHLLHRSLPQRITEPFYEHRGALYFLATWCTLGYLLFVLFIPAASLFFQRAYLAILGPGMLFTAMLFAGLARSIGPRSSIWLTCLLFGGFVLMNVGRSPPWGYEHFWHKGTWPMLRELRAREFRPGTRIYATPSDHLTLTYYTGLPIQSISPVRKEFLDHHPGDIVLIEAIPPLRDIQPDEVTEAARRRGIPVSPEQAKSWATDLTRAGMARYIQPRVARVHPQFHSLPPFAEQVLAQQLESTRRLVSTEHHPAGSNPAVFRGVEFHDYSMWWQGFFYRFAGLDSRTGDNLNIRSRLRNSDAFVQPTGWLLYLSPGPGGNANHRRAWEASTSDVTGG